MALTDLKVFSEFAYGSMTEKLRENIDIVNGQSNGCIVLEAKANVGDFSDPNIMWKKVTGGTVKRRDAYGAGVNATAKLSMLSETMVKVAAGTPTLEYQPGDMQWIQQNPKAAGIAFGEQLAADKISDMIKVGLASAGACLKKAGATVATTDVNGLVTYGEMVTGSALFGDAFSDLKTVVMNGVNFHNLIKGNLQNVTKLFMFGDVTVYNDAMGRQIIVTDNASTGNGTDGHATFMLSQGGILVQDNGDWLANEQTVNGKENIYTTYQAQWSYQLGIKGFAWAKAKKSPTDADLIAAASWNKESTSIKDLAGVVIVKP